MLLTYKLGFCLGDLLTALDQLIEMKAGKKNLRAKLIVAELKEWASGMEHSEAIVRFREMLRNLRTRSQLRDDQERIYMKGVFRECAHLNLMAKRAIEMQQLVNKQFLEV